MAFDAADLTGGSALTNVGNGSDALNAIVIWNDSITSGTGDGLIAYIDTGTGFDVTPNSSTIEITWASGTNKIFSLGA